MSKPGATPLPTPLERIRGASIDLRAALMALPSGDELATDVDELIKVARKEQHLTVVANTCNTPADHRRANLAEEALEEAREKFIAKWGGR